MPMKICLVCSPGGHLTQMLRLIEMGVFEGHKTFFITHCEKNTQNLENVYFVGNNKLNFLKYIPTFLLELKILSRERPDIIISTGAEIAIPICYIGKFMGKKIIYVESLSRIRTRSGTGKIIYPIADLFLVQWECLLKKYGKKAQYWGNVI